MVASSRVALLVDRAKRGETEAFSELVTAHLRAVYLTALSVIGNPSDAEDVAQDAFFVAFERLETCREPERFSGWLLRIVRNRALNHLAARRVRDVSKIEADIAHENDKGDGNDFVLRKRLLEALTYISEVQREIVLLHDLEGWTHAEIADVLDLSESMCRQHLFCARRELRARLTFVASQEFENGK